MAFGDRKVRLVGPVCDAHGCQRPQHTCGLCAAHWLGATEVQRRFLLIVVPEPEKLPETATQHSVERLIAGIEGYLAGL